jgi:DivIVA domain-containing protein
MKTIFDPEEIALKKFVVRWRGYDTREVETFLRAIAVDFRRLIDGAAAADQPATTGDDLAEVRDELSRLSSRLDRALAGLEAAGSTEPAGQGESTASAHHSALSTEPADETDPAATAGLHQVCGRSAGG